MFAKMRSCVCAVYGSGRCSTDETLVFTGGTRPLARVGASLLGLGCTPLSSARMPDVICCRALRLWGRAGHNLSTYPY